MSEDAATELQMAASRIKPAVIAVRVWERLFSEEERECLGGDLEVCWRRFVSSWAKLMKPSSLARARTNSTSCSTAVDWPRSAVEEIEKTEIKARPAMVLRARVLYIANPGQPRLLQVSVNPRGKRGFRYTISANKSKRLYAPRRWPARDRRRHTTTVAEAFGVGFGALFWTNMSLYWRCR